MQDIFHREEVENDSMGRAWDFGNSTRRDTTSYELAKHAQLFVILGRSQERVNIMVCSGTGSLVTSSQVSSRLNLERLIREESKVISTKAQIDDLRKKMGLNMSEIATIMGVSRQAIYDWIDDDSKLRREHQARFDILTEICLLWSQKKLGRLGSYLYKKINNENKSLFELLQDKIFDKKYIIQMLEKIEQAKMSHKENLESHKSILEKYGFEEINEKEADKNLDKITRKIG